MKTLSRTFLSFLAVACVLSVWSCSKDESRICPAGAVDLGLSVFWASCNLDVSNPDDCGGYYQWAGLDDTTDESIDLSWENCPYSTCSGSTSTWTKYIPSDMPDYWSAPGSPDNRTVLDPDDDVAQVRLGGTWRTPTKAEWDELCNTDNCSWTWTSMNGIDGYKVQSKKTGFTDNWIFLPAAGCRSGRVTSDLGSIGRYWSSSLCAGYPCGAYILKFDSGCVYTDYGNRCSGFSVRPVSE